jgi:hypothetical protein
MKPMKWKLMIGCFLGALTAFASVPLLSASSATVSSPMAAYSVAALSGADLTNLSETQLQTLVTRGIVTCPVEVASVTTEPSRPVTVVSTPVQEPASASADEAALTQARADLATAQEALKQKELVIKKLSVHLSSALARLNQGDAPAANDQRLAVALALKSRLEKENASLRQSVTDLKVEVAQSERRMQLFDLENRKIVAAFGSARQDLPVERIAQNYIKTTGSYAAH